MKEANFEELVVQCTSQKVAVRVPAYRTITQKSTGELEKFIWSDFASLDDTHKTLVNIKADLFNETHDISYEAAGVCGCLLANDSFLSLVNSEDEANILDVLIRAIKETKEKKVLTRSLWSLAKSRLNKNIYLKRVHQIIETINGILTVEDASSITVHEAMQVIQSLLGIIPNEMGEEAKQWFPSVFIYMFHDVGRVRIAAFATLSKAIIVLEKMEDFDNIRLNIVKVIIPDLKAQHCKQMNRLVGEECIDILKEWKMIVKFLGKELHPGTSLINGLLEVVEKGFKSSKPEIRVDAFKCWQALIDNFSLDDSVLTHLKRLKLLLAPLKANNAKTEDIAYAKLLAWWHLICKLGKKASLNFDLIVIPLLRFCFGCGSPSGGAAIGLSERNLIMSGATASPGRKFSGLHIACAEILAQILSVGLDIPGLQAYSFSTQQMDVPILTSPTLFVRYHQLLLNCISEAVQSLNSKEHKQYNLGVFLFQAVLAHIRVAINLDENKKDNVEIVKELFNTISSLERLCSPGDSQSQFVFKFLEMVTVGSLALPRTVLNSRHYHIATGNTMRDVMSGTLSNHLIHQLCKPSLLHYATSKEGFFSMWLAVLANSKPLSGKLGFLQSVMKELDCAAAVLCPANPNTLVQMWSTVVHQLIEHIQETQIIDQGDGGEHDWSCIYSILLFPINHSIDALSSADHLVYQQIMTDWIELWIKFTELTPLTPTADANSEVEHVARALINVCVGKLTAPPDIHAATYTLMAHVLAVITEKFTYSELGKTSVRSVNSPAKPRKKPHPLHNLAACVELYVILLQRVLRIVSNQRQRAAAKLCDAIVHVFKGVQQTKMVESLVEQVISPMCDSLKVNPAARFNAEIEKKFITTFKSFGALLEKYFGTKHSADQLNRIAPLFVVSLKSSNKHIKLEAHKLWRSSFASTSLCIPSNLFDILKECGLPPASLTDLHENMEDSLSLSPKENLPANQAGSLLKHDIVGERKLRESPRVNSPLSGRINRSTPVSKNKSKPKTKLEDMKDEDFVKITSPKPKRRVLTEHQVERMTERRSDIPALYSELSQAVSQDILPSQFASQYSFEDSSVDMKKGSSFKKPDTNDSKCSELKEATGGNSSVNKPSIDDLSFKGKLSSNTQNQPESERDEKEANELEKNTKPKNDAAKPFSKSVVDNGERTEQSEAKTKDTETSAGCGELESMNVIEMFENTEGNEINQLKIQSKKEINEMANVVNGTASDPKLLNPSEECDEQDKSEDSDEDSECVIRTDIKTYSGKKKKDLRRYGSGDSDYTDEDLNEELRRTSLEFQKSLDSLSDDSNTALKSSEFHRRKAKAPTKKNINDVRKSLKGTVLSKKVSSDTSKIDSPLPSKKQMQEQRINFKEVAVSPSVILDCKIAKQVPEVKLKDGALLAKQLNSKYAVSDTDSEDEIPDSQVAEKTDLYVSVFNRESPISLRGKSISVIRDKNRNTNEVPRKFSRSKRKRNSSEDDELTVNLDKKKKIKDKTQQLPIEKQSSSDDSVLIIEDKGGEQEEDKQGLCQKKGKENQKQQKVIEEISVMAARKMPKSQTRLTRKNSFNSTDSHPSSDHAGSNLSPCTPTKVTRSGRKIVAPNKDMPEPMTPPSSKKRKLQESTEESCVDDPKVTETSSLKITPKKSIQKKITDLFNKSDKKISEMEANDNSDGDTLPEMDDLNDSQFDDKDDYAPRKEESTSTDSEVDADDHTLEGNKSVLVMYQNISSSVAQEPKYSSTKESPRKDTGSLGEKSNERDTPIKTLNEEGEGSSSDVDVDGDDTTNAQVKSGDTSTVCKSEEDIKCNKILGKSTRHSKIKENITSKSEIVNDIIPCVSNLSEVNDVMQIGESLEPEGDREPQTTSANDVLSPVKGKSEAVMHKNENNTLEESSSSQDDESVHEQQNEIHGNSDKKLSNCSADKSVTAKNGQCRIEIIKANTNDQELSNKSKKLENLLSVEVTKGSETSRKSDTNVPSESSSKEICILNSPELNNRSSEAKINVCEEVVEGTLDQKNIREGVDDSNVTCIEYSENDKKELVKKNDRDSVKYNNNNESEKADKNLESVSFKAAEKTLSAFSVAARQQEEEHSPEKPCMSRLNSAVSTPERQKKKGSFKYAGSRAAMLVACAKQNIRNREANEGDSPCKCGGDASRYRHSGSPNRRSAPCRVSPSTPPNRKRKFVDSEGGRPWVKYEPSPGASPSTSILKKSTLDESFNKETPSPPTKCRRVSFADPPVSDRVEIPPSPTTLKRIRAQKRLDMTNASSPGKDIDFPCNKESQEADSPALLDCSQALYPSLTSCKDKVDQVAHLLTSPALVEGLMAVLEELGVRTVGELSQLTEADVNKLPVRAPKIAATVKILKMYEETALREGKKSPEPPLDEVEAQLSEIFGAVDREDKENQQPNNQDHFQESRKSEGDILENEEMSENRESNVIGDVPSVINDILEIDDITPLDASPDDLVPDNVIAVFKKTNENPKFLESLADTLNTDAIKTLFPRFMNKLQYSFLIDSFHKYLKSRNIADDT